MVSGSGSKSAAGLSSTPALFEQARTTTIEQGEDEEVALERLYGSRSFHESLKRGRPDKYKQVSYFTVGGREAGELWGVADASIISCYPYEVPLSWSPKGKDAGLYRKYTLNEVKEQLLRGVWTPGSALSMMRWLIANKSLGLMDTTELETRLYRKLPHFRAMDACPDRSETAFD